MTGSKILLKNKWKFTWFEFEIWKNNNNNISRQTQQKKTAGGYFFITTLLVFALKQLKWSKQILLIISPHQTIMLRYWFYTHPHLEFPTVINFKRFTHIRLFPYCTWLWVESVYIV